jgi:hypothetical protein
MRRVIPLWTSVALAALVAGLVVAETTFPQTTSAQDTSASGTGSTSGTGAASGTGSGTATGTTGTGTTATGTTATGTTATGTTATGATAPAAAPEDMEAGTYAVRLRDLEQRIDALKEQIFRSKARLSLLAETVLGGVVAGAQAVVVHENRMSSSYRLVKAVYALDGARLFSKADEEGSLGDQPEFEIYNGSIVPGEHNVTVNLEYRGHGYGIFSYLKGYRFRVRSSYTFSAPEGKAITIRVVGYEKGGPTAPLEERPAIRYMERVESTGRGEGAGSGEPASSGGGAASSEDEGVD